MTFITDKYGRSFRTLRVSLLQQCNLACVYCVAEDHAGQSARLMAGQSTEAKASGLGHAALSAPELLALISRLHGQLGLETVRLTGGEPLLYQGLAALVRALKEMGIPSVKLTTNGFLLDRMAGELKGAGVDSLNVSLDAIEEKAYIRMSRRHSVSRIIRGIESALEAGLPVKLNAVMMKGGNEDQLLPLLEFAFARKLRIRFLEVMRMGHLYETAERYLMTQKEILECISERYTIAPLERSPSATARYWTTDTGNVFGIVANESEPFCGDCNRLRLDSQGNIYGCLSSNRPIRLDADTTEAGLRLQLEEAMQQKQPVRFTGSALSMLHIGG